MQTEILNKINSPEDVKKLSISEMNILADEIRQGILNRVDQIGGHLGPGLGITEATIALHYVYNSPVDKFVFDVSHQCYPHKMLTGRKEGFINPKDHPEISGYFNYNESPHDPFMIGHTSTSISLATGIAKARDLKGEKYNVIALIGDGSLSGGEAFEGLNNASVLGSNFIIIVNDNEMSIAENQGGLYKNLEELRNSNGQAQNNFFKSFGFDYHYVENGNDIQSLINIFEQVKNIDHPVVVHIHTLKGKGFEPAVTNKETGHWSMPGLLSKDKNLNFDTVAECYETITNNYILEKIKQDKTVIPITSATPGVFWWNKDFRNQLGENYTDVGIAEEHAVAYASGLAKNGARPIYAVMTSFIQRTYDQLSQDLALNNSPATILVYWGGISGADATHLGLFDIPLICNIPNIVYLAPTCKEEYLRMLDWSVEQTKYSVAIRVPSANFVSTGVEDKTDYSILNKYQLVEKGEKVGIIALGDFFELGKEVKKELLQSGINATLINPKFITGIDKELLNSLKSDHKVIITLENGTLDGGFGEKISRFFGDSNVKVLNYGASKEFIDRVPIDELLERYHLKKELIVQDVNKILLNTTL
ncbi:1-deoxy-D-xylulose-5-phosphate synthase [bacterium]|nr:1-deoxy-D-xylulose-5-phosphate synthase [bacterium]